MHGIEFFIIGSFGIILVSAVWRLVVSIQTQRAQKDLADHLAVINTKIERLLTAEMRRTEAAHLQRLEKAQAVSPETAAVLKPEPQPAPAPLTAEEIKIEPPEPVRPEPWQPVSAAHPPASPLQAVPKPPRLPEIERSLPPRPAPAPRKQSQFEKAAIEALHKVWNWIIVGDRPEGVSFEYAVATNWLLRIGVLVLVLGFGFFLRYSIQQGLIGPEARVALSIIAGAAMIGGGIRLLGRRYHLFGQGLVGGGLGVLYFSFYAAAGFYKLIGAVPAFGLMALVTLASGVLAVRFNSMLIAILGIIGGYLTPIMLSTDSGSLPALFSYMLLLGLGILGIAHRRQWLLLNWLGFLGTYALTFAALAEHYDKGEFWMVMPFLLLFFLLYTTVNFLYNLVNRKATTTIELIGLCLNAALFFTAAQSLITDVYGQQAAAVVSLGLTALYVLMVLFFIRRGLKDRALLLTLLALAAFFLTITMPLLFSKEWITVSWALQALLLLWLGRKLDSRFVVYTGYLLYLLVFWRLAFMDLGSMFEGGARAARGLAWPDYRSLLLNRIMVFGVSVASFAGAWRLHRQPPAASESVHVGRNTDVREIFRNNQPLRAFMWLAVVTAFVYLHLELNCMFTVLYQPLRLPLLTALWCGLCLWLLFDLAAAGTWRRPLLFTAFAAVFVKLIFVDLNSWSFSLDSFRYASGHGYLLLDAGMRLLNFGLILVLLSFACRFLLQRPREVDLGRYFGITALGLLFLYLTLEVNTALHSFVPGLRGGGVSLLWSLFALGLVIAGIRRNLRRARLAGLILFAVIAWKVFLVDLAHLNQLYRIITFMLLGILILCGSLLYLRNRHKFLLPPPEAK